MLRDAHLQRVIAWAEHEDNILALILTGSLARNDGTADALSDIDIELIARHPARLAADERWLGEIGELITVLRLNADDGQEWPTRLAIYSPGVKVDFTLAGAGRVSAMSKARKLDPLYRRGYRVLLDKAGLATNLPVSPFAPPRLALPSQQAFSDAVEEFWFEASHVPKYLVRSELWPARLRDWAMKELLLRMLEWHALAKGDPAPDVWHNGLRMDTWLDSGVRAQLHECFGRLDPVEARRAFDATIGLYSRVAKETAGLARLRYPQPVEDGIRSANALVFGLENRGR
ncbi:aminoglycoside 6-adenylyltransferase [Cupriavidus respiraculi]|uniref:Aminoglycoside 6-adenylyltransferase n=2 Tax=Cupriavidus respiraculi TaxID=195930 RepID=A0ABM8WMG1_9BURK|nr:hypothetical protein LMG21510_01136 [Cupriavidus respiraculi]